MKRVFVSLLTLLSVTLSLEAVAQSVGGHEIEVRQENRIEGKKSKKNSQKGNKSGKSSKKEQRAMEGELAHKTALSLLTSREFVMEANKVSMPDGSSVSVFSDVNYLMMKGDKAVVQVNPGISGGPNGMGGITLEGRVVDLTQTTDKRGNVTLEYTVMSTGGSAEVELLLIGGGDKVNATIKPKMHSSRVIMFGRLLAPENSRVFKGFSM